MRALVRAPAKLTLSLRVVGVRDDGYHRIEAEMVTLSLADMLELAEGDSLVVDGPHAAGVPTDDSNLIRRALRLVGRAAAVHVEKQIPAGGGLGGGSADAAAVLRWAGVRDLEVAATLGADVPFCLVGGRAMVTGVGERVSPLPPVDRVFTLVTPPLSISTSAVYAAWDMLGARRSDGLNDLEPAAIMVAPELAHWRDRLASVLGVSGGRPALAGSGATWFVEGAHPDLARALPDANVVVTRTDRP